MNVRALSVVFFALAMISSATAAPAKSHVEYADLVTGQIQIIGKLGVPLGQVVRIEATVGSADKIWPDSGVYRERYLLSLHTIDGRKVHDTFMPFQVHTFAVSRLPPGRIELGDKLKTLLKRDPTDDEIIHAEADLHSSRKRTFLVYEWVSFSGVPAKLPADVATWSGTAYGPNSTVVVIKELEPTK